MIAIVDYGLGNILAFANVYKRLNIEAMVARNPDELRGASKVILPGVGAFDHAMELLNGSGMRETLDTIVLERGVPVIGICVGMQILARGSDEGSSSGLGWIDGHVRSLRANPVAGKLPQPHMGWNDVQPVAAHPLFRELEQDARFYFLHSYYFECKNREHIAAQSRYGIEFGCAVSAGNIHGVQFHPEKSHHFGAQLLKNFAEL